jgi:D-alanyl-D-alanine carboxypeptidase (penicillin-binding protein 5/6)
MSPTLLGILLLLFSFAVGTFSVWFYLSQNSGAAEAQGAPSPPGTTSTVSENPSPQSPIGELAPDGVSTPPASSPATRTPSGVASPAVPTAELTARAAFIMDVKTGAVLLEQNSVEPMPPASTAKIITALTVLRHARPDEVVTVAPEDVVDPVQESTMGLQAGDTVTVHDLLVGLLVPSGNDPAKALARYIGERLPGDPNASPAERFVAEMNATAAALGMAKSHLAHPAGDDVDGQVVTARGMAMAARELLSQPALLRIVAMQDAEVRVGGPQARVIRLANTNELLSQPGIYGIKTGTTGAAKQCLVVAHRSQDRNVIAVVLGSTDRYADARALLGVPQPSPSGTESSPAP